MTMFETLRKMLMAGFGAQEKFSELIDDLVRKGELSETQGAKLVKEWGDKASKGTTDLEKTFGEVVTKALEKMNIPTKEDLRKMDKKIQALSARVRKIEELESEESQ